MAEDLAIEVIDNAQEEKTKHNTTYRKQKKRQEFKLDRRSTPSRPEWRYQLFICVLVLVESISTRLGQIASVWATTILLGGFITGLNSYDFWVISSLTLASSVRLFGTSHEQNLNSSRSETRRSVVLRWVYASLKELFGGPPKFHIAGSTLVAGTLDLATLVLVFSSAMVSFVFSVLRLLKNRDFITSHEATNNQRQAMIVYYSLVVVETALFIPAKLFWEMPRPFDKNIIYSLTTDKETMGSIFQILDEYYLQALLAARRNVAHGLNMSLRRHISEMLQERQDKIDNAAGILTLDVLYQRDEWIKRKADADKRVKLLPLVLKHIDTTRNHESREAAISLLTSLLVNKTDTKEPSKFGPLVLFKALDYPEYTELLTNVVSIQQPVSGYLESCLRSRSKDEVLLALHVVRKLPTEFFLKTNVPKLMLELLTLKKEDRNNRHYSSPEVSIPMLVVLALSDHGMELPDKKMVSSILNKKPKLRELEILVELQKHGILTTQDIKSVNIAHFFKDVNFSRCLSQIVQWLSSLEDNSSAQQVQLKKLRHSKDYLVEYLQHSRARNRPDIYKLCRLLVKDEYFSSTFEELPHLNELLKKY